MPEEIQALFERVSGMQRQAGSDAIFKRAKSQRLRHRRRRVVAGVTAALAIGGVAIGLRLSSSRPHNVVAAGRGQTATSTASVTCATERSGVSARPGSAGVSWPPSLDLAGLLRSHFAGRYAIYWLSSFQRPDASDQVLVVAVTDPSAADRAWVSTLPVVGARAVVVASRYSEQDFARFSTAITDSFPIAPAHRGPTTDTSPQVTGVGMAIDVPTASGRPVLQVSVSSCDRQLVQAIDERVPADALMVIVGGGGQLQ